MRIVVKPAGLLIVIAMIGVLATLAFVKNRKPSSTAAVNPASAATPASPSLPAAVPQDAAPTNGNLLSNSGFESTYSPVPPPWSGAKGKADGAASVGWHDDSLWGPVDIHYSSDEVKPHSGASSQRIELKSVTADGKCQFVQEIAGVEGKTYREVLWVRASKKDVPVTLLLRQKDSPFLEYKSVTTKVGTEWQKLTLDGTASQQGSLFFMVSFNTPATTIWLDDAKMTVL